MDDLDQELIIRIYNDKSHFQIQSKEINLDLEKIKKKCQEEFKYDEKDMEKINLWYVDKDKDKNLISNEKELILYAEKIDSSKFLINLTLELNSKINLKEENKIEEQKKKGKDIYINEVIERKNQENNNEINKLKKEIEFLKEEIKYHKQRNKNIILKYEELLDDYRAKSELMEINNKKNAKSNINDQEIKNNNINFNNDSWDFMTKNQDQCCYQNPLGTNSNNINNIVKNDKLKDKGKEYHLKDLEFINIRCKKCSKKSIESIYKCAICDNDYLCKACFNSNIKTKFHEHEFFHIIFPNGIYNQIEKKEIENKNFNNAVSSFYNFLKEIFFDKNGIIIVKEINNKELKNLTKICNKMHSLNADPLEYFSEYQKTLINKELINDKQLKEKIFKNITEIINNISNAAK